MPIPLGVLAVAGAGAGPVGAGNAYELLETQILSSGAASVTFSNLNTNYGSTYQHLQLRISVNSSRAASEDTLYMYLNNVITGTSYANHRLIGNGSTVTSNATTSTFGATFNEILANDYWPASSPMILDFLDPFETTKNKTIRAMHASQDYGIRLQSILFASTAALTTIRFEFANGNVRAGSRFSLYGLRSA